uniref:Uncharacterized protein n=1 Tax=viral metagenome TaxID=1070528 RepID=A0A6C0LSS0_9ZZZZ
MEFYVKILIIIVLICIILYYNQPDKRIRENFEGIPDTEFFNYSDMPPVLPPNTGYRPGHGLRHPDQDVVWDAINNRKRNDDVSTFEHDLDPEVIAKMKETILTDVSRTSKTEVAYNDAGVYRSDRIRPFNDVHSLISTAEMENGLYLADEFDNTFYSLWETDEQREADRAMKRAEEIEKSKMDCLEFENVNQCMSVCTNTDHCVGFYINSPNTCCMLIDPPYVTNRHSYNKLPNNVDAFGRRTLNNLIRRAEATDNKIVFDYIRTDGGNHTYKVDMDRKECKKLCPKCIIGRCPPNYRCTNLTADPRYNYSCLITNEDRYDETTGQTFDSSSVPYLDEKWGLNEYADFDDDNTRSVLTIPPSNRYKIDDKIVPNRIELDQIFAKYDANHVGPNTYQNDYPKLRGFDDIIDRKDEPRDPLLDITNNIYANPRYENRTMDKAKTINDTGLKNDSGVEHFMFTYLGNRLAANQSEGSVIKNEGLKNISKIYLDYAKRHDKQ